MDLSYAIGKYLHKRKKTRMMGENQKLLHFPKSSVDPKCFTQLRTRIREIEILTRWISLGLLQARTTSFCKHWDGVNTFHIQGTERFYKKELYLPEPKRCNSETYCITNICQLSTLRFKSKYAWRQFYRIKQLQIMHFGYLNLLVNWLLIVLYNFKVILSSVTFRAPFHCLSHLQFA